METVVHARRRFAANDRVVRGIFRSRHQMTASGSHACRSCGHTDLKTILSLGHTPLANALLTEAQLQQEEETFPLDLVVCPECTLVQITETVSPEKLFREYFYLSSFSDTMLRHAADLAERMISSRN